jgi:hypothetical protein
MASAGLIWAKICISRSARTGKPPATQSCNMQATIEFRCLLGLRRIPESLMIDGGLDFLLRQAVVVACTWSSLFFGMHCGKRPYDH